MSEILSPNLVPTSYQSDRDDRQKGAQTVPAPEEFSDPCGPSLAGGIHNKGTKMSRPTQWYQAQFRENDKVC